MSVVKAELEGLDEAIAKAIEICAKEAGIRTTICFELGAVVLGIPHVYHAVRSKWGRKTGGDDSPCVRDIFRRVSAAVNAAGASQGFQVPVCPTYWYCGVRSHKVWTASQRAMLVERRVPWTYLVSLQALPDFGVSLFPTIASGELKGGELRRLARGVPVASKNGKRARSMKLAPKVERCLAITGTKDEMQVRLESILYAALSRNYDVEEMVEVALARVRKLVERVA